MCVHMSKSGDCHATAHLWSQKTTHSSLVPEGSWGFNAGRQAWVAKLLYPDPQRRALNILILRLYLLGTGITGMCPHAEPPNVSNSLYKLPENFSLVLLILLLFVSLCLGSKNSHGIW